MNDTSVELTDYQEECPFPLSAGWIINKDAKRETDMNPNFEIKPRLMTPGPVKLSKQVLSSLSSPMIHHRAPEFNEILDHTLKNLKLVFKTKQPVMMLSSTGSGAMEAALVNTLNHGDHVAVISSGKFGDRWSQIAQAYGLKVTTIDVPWGEPATPEAVEVVLQAHPNIKALCTQACETSTATLHPIKALSKVAEKHDVLILVDAITALATTELDMDAWGLDVVVAGSQKAFMLPTGLSFIALSEKAWKAQAQSNLPKFYLNIAQERDSNLKGQTFFSSNVPLIKALKGILEGWAHEGLAQQIKHTQRLQQATIEASKKLGFTLLSKAPAPAVTALLPPGEIKAHELQKHLLNKYLVTVMGGQDQLKGKIIRIGHMGAISNNDVLATLYFLAKSLIDCGFDVSDETLSQSLELATNILNGQ